MARPHQIATVRCMTNHEGEKMMVGQVRRESLLICFSPIRFCSSLFFRRWLSAPNTISSCIPPHATPALVAVVAPKATTSPAPPPIPVSTGSWHCLLPLCFHSTSSPPFPCLHLPAYATIKKLLFSFHFSIPSLPSSTCIGF